jgi:hypothetical protein
MKATEKKLGEKNERRAARLRPDENDLAEDIRAGTLPEVEPETEAERKNEEEVVADPEGARRYGETPAA